MSIVILIAPTAETASAAWTTLRQSDLADAAPSRRERLTPQQVQQLMLKTLTQHRSMLPHQLEKKLSASELLKPNSEQQGVGAVHEKIWTELATDLFLGNLDHVHFGWCQPLDEHTPAFWQRFDPETKFVLVYEEPLSYATHVIEKDLNNSQDVTSILENWQIRQTLLLKTFYELGTCAVLVPASQISNLKGFIALAEMNAPAEPDDYTNPTFVVLSQLIKPLLEVNEKVKVIWQELQDRAVCPVQEIFCDLPAKNRALEEYIQQQKMTLAVQQQNANLTLTLQNMQNENKAIKDFQKNKYNSLNQEYQHVSNDNVEAQQESELLLSQLHQVQEELEYYFLKYQDQRKQVENVVNFWCKHTPAELWVDMRQTPDGNGWYEVEADGRWSGPNRQSEIDFPPLAAGKVTVELHIADAMLPELVADMQLSAHFSNGKVKVVNLVHEFGSVDHLYPMVSTGLLELPDTEGSWRLHILLPKVISPMEFGVADTRNLGLRLRGVRLSLDFIDKSDLQPDKIE